MKNRKKKFIFLKIVLIVFFIFLFVPAVLVFIYSLFENWVGILPSNFSLDNYKNLFSDKSFIKALYQSAFFALLPVVIMTILIILAIYVVIFIDPFLEKYLKIASIIPYAFQGVILSISVMNLYGKNFKDYRDVLLVGTYTIIIFPVLYQNIINSIKSIDYNIIMENAMLLGSSPFKAYIGIIIPSVIQNILVGSMLSVTLLFGDYVIIRNMASKGISNLQIYLYNTMKQSSSKASSVFVIILILTMFIIFVITYIESKITTDKTIKKGHNKKLCKRG